MSIYKSQSARSVAIVIAGTAISQFIAVASSPVITRLYGPENFGLLSLFMAIVSILGPLTALTYPMAIVLPRQDHEAKAIFRLSLFLAIGISSLFGFIFYFWGEYLFELLNAKELTTYSLLIPFSMLFGVVLQIGNQWLIRKKNYKIVATNSVAQSFFLSTAKIGVGYISPTAIALIFITSLTSALNAGILMISIRKIAKSAPKVATNSEKVHLRYLAKKYLDFPVYRAPQVLINTISQNLPVMILATLFGMSSAGFYGIARTLLSMPIALISQSVGSVLYGRMSEAVHSGENLTKLIVKSTAALALIGIIPFSLIFAFGPWIFSFIFGVEWMLAGEYARWLALMSFFGYLNRPSVVAIPIFRMQSWLLKYELFSTISKIFALYIGFFVFRSDVAAIAIFSTFGALTYIYLILQVINISRSNNMTI